MNLVCDLTPKRSRKVTNHPVLQGQARDGGLESSKKVTGNVAELKMEKQNRERTSLLSFNPRSQDGGEGAEGHTGTGKSKQGSASYLRQEHITDSGTAGEFPGP